MNTFADFQRVLGYKQLSSLQQKVAQVLLDSDSNAVISAPTGSGKTLLLEMALYREFFRSPQESDAATIPTTVTRDSLDSATSMRRRAVYVCPLKALANEKFGSWSTAFSKSNIRVVLETGDQDPFEAFDRLLAADVLVTTPERWDSLTRRWRDAVAIEFVSSVTLLLIDEVHMLSETRGSVLEALVSRMLSVATFRSASPPRLVAVSGTIPNIVDVADWLRVPPEGRFSFSDEERPVPLQTHVRSFPSRTGNAFTFESFLNHKLSDVIREYGAGHPTLVFCTSRKGAVITAQALVGEIKQNMSSSVSTILPDADGETFEDHALRELVKYGVAFHHAALSAEDRNAVERLFRQKLVCVLCTTSTLAAGVNLPARLVVVKGTGTYRNGAKEHLSLTDVRQMAGRAGRFGLDTTGTAVILTSDDEAPFYRQLEETEHCTLVESQMHKSMIEHVNSEIVLRTIATQEQGVSWLQTTYLWIRLRRAPEQYGIFLATKAEERNFDAQAFALDLISTCLRNLVRCKCITASSEDPKIACYTPTRLGRLMAKYYINIETVEKLHSGGFLAQSLDASPSSGSITSLEDALRLLSQTSEICTAKLRSGDKGQLNLLNKLVKFPLASAGRSGREIQQDWHKPYVLLQMFLANKPIESASLRNDLFAIRSSASRVAKFLHELSLLTSSFSFITQSFALVRCIEAHSWDSALPPLPSASTLTPARMPTSEDVTISCQRASPSSVTIKFTILSQGAAATRFAGQRAVVIAGGPKQGLLLYRKVRIPSAVFVPSSKPWEFTFVAPFANGMQIWGLFENLPVSCADVPSF